MKKSFNEVTNEKKHEPSAVFVPTVRDKDGSGYDIFSLLLKERVVILPDQVNEATCTNVIAQLKYLEHLDPNKEIQFVINSPGGSVIAGMALYDTMRGLSCPIATIGNGMCASMGSILLAAGDTRQMTPNAKLMIHQISGGSQGQASDTEIRQSFSQQLHEDLKNVYVRHIGLKHEFWDTALERDTWLTAEQALRIGFIDHIAVPQHKTAAYENEAVRESFQKAKDSQVPKTYKEIMAVINNSSAEQGKWGKIRPELVVALAQCPEVWTEGKKKAMAAKAAQSAPANQNIPASVTKAAKKAAPTAPKA